MRRLRECGEVDFSGQLRGTLVPSETHDRITLEFRSTCGDSTLDVMHRLGSMPIPPYIREGRGDDDDKHDYQTIFAARPGSVAAPTASLHFTDGLVRQIKSLGCSLSFVTLHVGTASFLPVVVNGEVRPPGSEHVTIPDDLLEQLNETKRRGGRVIGVGTTVVRALESAAAGAVDSSGTTSLFITPGFRFRIVDSVITNFHQPGTTHLLLVEALLGRDLLAATYEHALAAGYRFLSYGDGTLIV
jgi:S-adenosylmethionine:tRNA ribosyltransferase-isomerase